MARLQLAKKRRQGNGGTGRALVVALASFAVLCGLLLVIVGAPGLRCGLDRTTTTKLLSALRSINRADRDLEAGNYGNARVQVRAAQEALTGAITELQGSAD